MPNINKINYKFISQIYGLAKEHETSFNPLLVNSTQPSFSEVEYAPLFGSAVFHLKKKLTYTIYLSVYIMKKIIYFNTFVDPSAYLNESGNVAVALS